VLFPGRALTVLCLCVLWCCRYLRFKPNAAGAVTWVSPSLQSIDAFTGNIMAGKDLAALM
jgi:hypothetical protein